MITAAQIIEQARSTLEVTGETGANRAWEFAYSTWSAAAEDEEEVCSLIALEVAFNMIPLHRWN